MCLHGVRVWPRTQTCWLTTYLQAQKKPPWKRHHLQANSQKTTKLTDHRKVWFTRSCGCFQGALSDSVRSQLAAKRHLLYRVRSLCWVFRQNTKRSVSPLQFWSDFFFSLPSMLFKFSIIKQTSCRERSGRQQAGTPPDLSAKPSALCQRARTSQRSAKSRQYISPLWPQPINHSRYAAGGWRASA